MSPTTTPPLRFPRTTAAPPANGVLLTAADVLRLLRIEIENTLALERITFPTRRLRQGDTLLHAGDTFQSLYVVRSGTFKTVALDAGGSEQVVAFPIKGDVIGIDGIDAGRYASAVIALEASEVAILPFARLAHLTRECAELETMIYRTISRELVRDQGLLWMMGSLHAEARVAAFLLNLADRLGAIGYSRSSFILRMTRQEIGSYLGLKLETVSRAMSAFDAAGWLRVRQKNIEIVNADALRACLTGEPEALKPSARVALAA